MNSPLPPVSDIRFPQVLVVSASAGAGKTTALSRRYIEFLLSDKVPNNQLPNILAITFTNNAAAEMKRKILTELKLIALGVQDLIAVMVPLTGLRSDQISIRAGNVLDGILENYTDFQVRTIDSFLSNIFTASAIEFGIAPGFDISLTHEDVLDRGFAEFSVRIANDPDGSAIIRTLTDLADEDRKRDDPYAWDPYTAVARQVKKLYAAVTSLPRELAIPELSADLARAERELRTEAEYLLDLLENSAQLAPQHLLNDLRDIQRGDFAAVIDRAVKTKAVKAGTTKAEKEEAKRLEAAAAPMLERVNSRLSAYGLLLARRAYVPAARVLVLLGDTLEEMKRRDRIVLLDDAVHSLLGWLSTGVVPDVFIKLGDTIYHFLIDEFQDTSPAQWETLRPLIDNAVSTNGSLYAVGDTKQSIYGFRGADWRIMRQLMTTTVFPSAPPVAATLNQNFRSRPAIVNFVRAVFHDIVPSSSWKAAGEESGLSVYVQESAPGPPSAGHVEVQHIVRNDETEPELDTVVEIVKDCRARGRSWSDIAILTQANARVVRIASALNRADIPVIPQSSLDIRHRRIVAHFLALLRFLDAPVDHKALATVLLSELFTRRDRRISQLEVRRMLFEHAQPGQHRPLYMTVRERYREVWEELFSSLFKRVGFLPLYDLVAEAMKTFRVFELFPEEEGSLVRLLETVRAFEATGNNSLRAFIVSAEEMADVTSWELPNPSAIDAVNVMTIHKSKGLGFPVTIVLLYPFETKIGGPVPVMVDEGVELWRVRKKLAERVPEIRPVYDEALLREQVDALNRLYVALTRAREEMYVLAIADDPADEPASFLPASADDPSHRPRLGVTAKNDEPRVTLLFNDTVSPLPETTFEVLNDRERRRGEFLHALLAEVEWLDVTNASLENAIARMRPEDEGLSRDDVRSTLSALLDRPDVRELFTERPERTVLREQEIIAPDGAVHRLDRAVIDADTVIVVDFKTGGTDRETEYRRQVQRYVNLLQEIYPGKTMRGVLVYIDRLTVAVVA